MSISRIAAKIFPVSIGILASCVVSAQDYPNKIVRIVVSAGDGAMSAGDQRVCVRGLRGKQERIRSCCGLAQPTRLFHHARGLW